ncbi:hypothetical protein Tco_1499028 [Tanacetum coccineum]
MLESQKWSGYQVSLSALELKVASLEAEKSNLEATEASLRQEIEEVKHDRREVVSKVVPYACMDLLHSDELGRLFRKLVSSAITFGRCRAYEQVARMKEPFDLSKVKGYDIHLFRGLPTWQMVFCKVGLDWRVTWVGFWQVESDRGAKSLAVKWY